VVLVVWAIVPRWRSVLPRFVRPAVVAVRDLPGVSHARGLLGGYERWRSFRRLTGVFVAIAFVHGILDATPFPRAPALPWIYAIIGGVGLAFYLYRELFARHFVSLHDYQVEHVELLDDGMMETTLKPLGTPMHFVPGQYAMLYLEAAPGWRRHPFSIASPPSSDVVRFTVKARGDDTTAMRESVQPGMPVVIRGPFGRFSHGELPASESQPRDESLHARAEADGKQSEASARVTIRTPSASPCAPGAHARRLNTPSRGARRSNRPAGRRSGVPTFVCRSRPHSRREPAALKTRPTRTRQHAMRHGPRNRT
jgi:hypothetical protein